MLEKIIDWISKNECTTFWILDPKTDDKLSFYSEESTDLLVQCLREEFELMPDGSYYLKASKSANGFRNAKRINFKIGENKTAAKMASNYEDIERIREEAYLKGMERGREMARLDIVEKDVRDIKEKVNMLIKWVESREDEDDSNDFNFKDSLKPMMQAVIEKGASRITEL